MEEKYRAPWPNVGGDPISSGMRVGSGKEMMYINSPGTESKQVW